jgi:hypothetical protein
MYDIVLLLNMLKKILFESNVEHTYGFGHIWDNQATFSKFRTLFKTDIMIFGINYCSMIIE